MSVRDAETKDLNTPPVATSRLGVPLALTAIERRANQLVPVRWSVGEKGAAVAAVLVHLRADETSTGLTRGAHLMPQTIDRPVIDHDAELLEALRRRDATAAECLVSTFADRAYRLAIGITGNQQDAEEAVQDAFWSVVRNIDAFRGDAAMGSWIYRVTVNAANQRRRSRSRRRDDVSLDEILPSLHEDGRHAEPILDWSTEIDDPAIQSELRSVLTSALEELPDHYRAVIILHDVEGLSMAEVADCVNTTVPTAKSRAHRARLVLRKRLGVFMSGAPSGVEMVS